VLAPLGRPAVLVAGLLVSVQALGNFIGGLFIERFRTAKRFARSKVNSESDYNIPHCYVGSRTDENGLPDLRFFITVFP
jgi:hypothetical protein